MIHTSIEIAAPPERVRKIVRVLFMWLSIFQLTSSVSPSYCLTHKDYIESHYLLAHICELTPLPYNMLTHNNLHVSLQLLGFAAFPKWHTGFITTIQADDPSKPLEKGDTISGCMGGANFKANIIVFTPFRSLSPPLEPKRLAFFSPPASLKPSSFPFNDLKDVAHVFVVNIINNPS
jgi:hypothetical protein